MVPDWDTPSFVVRITSLRLWPQVTVSFGAWQIADSRLMSLPINQQTRNFSFSFQSIEFVQERASWCWPKMNACAQMAHSVDFVALAASCNLESIVRSASLPVLACRWLAVSNWCRLHSHYHYFHPTYSPILSSWTKVVVGLFLFMELLPTKSSIVLFLFLLR